MIVSESGMLNDLNQGLANCTEPDSINKYFRFCQMVSGNWSTLSL